MSTWKLLLRSLSFHRQTHLWVVLGTAVSTAILVGALIIGDSVRLSLRQIVLDRLGNTEFALMSGDRFLRAGMAQTLSERLGTEVAPILQARGIAIAQGGQRRLNNVHIIGVDRRFGDIGNTPEFYRDLAADEALVNQHLAARLDLRRGDDILIRFENLDFMPKDAPLALDTDSTIAGRYRIKAIAGDGDFGRFNLNADQIAPDSVYVSLSHLSEKMGLAGRANILLFSTRSGNPLIRQQVARAFRDAWSLADAGLEVRELTGRNTIELRSSRIFLDPLLVRAALTLDSQAQISLTYFVTELRAGERSTPYSFVAAPGHPIVSPEMADDEIIINEWLAGDLAAGVGDQIRLSYYIIGRGRELIEKSSVFRVKSIVPLTGIYSDRDLLPDFPGLAEVDTTQDWKPGIPIDLDRIREKDEDYWNRFRGTPKAFVTLGAAREMWQNRFGNSTAIRFESLQPLELEESLRAAVNPAHLGFVLRESRREGLLASSQGVDFGQLFLGLSFFVILAALILTGLLFIFNVEKRSKEHGLLLALGFTQKTVRRLVLREGAVLVVIGSLIGATAGILYNQIILLALKTVWQGAVGTSALQIHIVPATVVTGILIGTLIAFFTIWLVARKQVNQSVSALQRGLSQIDSIGKKKFRASLWIGIFSLLAVLVILAMSDFGGGRDAFAFFFIAGSLMLVSGMAFTNDLLFRVGKGASTYRLSLFHIGLRGTARRRGRSLMLVGILASGLFIVFTVGANRRNVATDSEKRQSGTGGFALYGESVFPVVRDLNGDRGRQFYGLDGAIDDSVRFVQFRVREGDDASCLNLNRVPNPRLIGVRTEDLIVRNPFTFVDMTDDVDPENPWAVLDQPLADGSIPAIADHTVIIWGMGKAVGDTLEYMDEKGEVFTVKLVGGLANSVFQGNVLMSENFLTRKYPSISGYRLFLIDAPWDDLDQVSEDIAWAMQDQGMDLFPTSQRLEEFNRVENTYLSIFLILGSFGLVLGSVGIGIVVWRNIRERQGELAVLRAIGFDRSAVRFLVLSEHLILLAAGIFYGLLAALLATLPALLAPGSGIPFLTMIVLLIIVMFNGVVWTYGATSLVTRENVLWALRNE